MDRRTRRHRRLFPDATAGLAAAAVLAALLAGCGDDAGDNDTADDKAGETSSADESPADDETPPSDDATEETSDGTTEGSGDTVAVPVYFVGETPQGPRLFREFRAVESDNPLEEAVALVTAGDALDPDYGTLFPPGAFASVTFADGEFVVEVADDAWRTMVDQGPEEARLAVQQLVYTVQGVEQTRATVRVVGPSGEPEPTLFGLDAEDGFEAAPQLEVLGLVNVTTPEEGAAVEDTFTAEGLASSFETTVPWEVRDADGNVVVDGFTTAEGWVDKLHPWEAEVDVSDLESGTYTFVALTDDPSGGEGGGPTEDSKTIVVE